MIERLLETWLDKANERSFQIPFCHWLTFKGHKVLHMTRHCAMEMGKDIISIDELGRPCAFQLKGIAGKRLTIGEWRADLGLQISPLVNERIVHPGVSDTGTHRSIIVINGHLDEEVSRAIDDFNQSNVTSGYPQRKLEVMVKGDLLKAFIEMKSEFWPTSVSGLRDYLELLTNDGNGPLDKRRLCNILASILPLSEPAEGESKPTENQCIRLVLSCAFFCATGISNYTNLKNHAAEFEAWTLLLLYTLALSEKWDIEIEKLHDVNRLIEEAMYTSLARLCDEVLEREHFVEGVALNAIADSAIYRVRVTYMFSLLAVYGLMKKERVRKGIETMDERDEELRKRFLANNDLWWLWGEYAVPQFLAINYFMRSFISVRDYETLFLRMIKMIIDSNRKMGHGLPNPYYDPETAMPVLLGVSSEGFSESFKGASYYLEGLLHLAVRTYYKQTIKRMFPEITKIAMKTYVPDAKWKNYLLRNGTTGKNISEFMQPPHTWDKLWLTATEFAGEDVPSGIKKSPLLYLCLLIVMPYRISSSGLRWFDSFVESGTGCPGDS